jgi:two-component system chemotaxis response regulator CheB
MSPIRTLIVDDSAFMRHALARILSEAGDIEVVGSVGNGELGLESARALHPDVITLDVEMPVMDGLTMLRRLMAETPTRVIMLSSLTTEGAAVTLDALDSGAIDFVAKPGGSLSIDIGRVGADLVAKIRAAAAMSEASFLGHRQRVVLRHPLAAPALRPAAARARSRPTVAARRLVVVASSTGGPGALHVLVSGLPDRLGAAMVLVQHMPPGFTASLAGRLDAAGPLAVAEAQAGDLLVEDEIVVAPGGHHLISSTTGHAQLVQLPPVNGVRPAADVTLLSVAPAWRERLLCVVLTGMGADGREGARAVKAHGGAVFAQDQASATIYGMPAAVAEAGLADQVLPLGQMAGAIAAWAQAR